MLLILEIITLIFFSIYLDFFFTFQVLCKHYKSLEYTSQQQSYTKKQNKNRTICKFFCISANVEGILEQLLVKQ